MLTDNILFYMFTQKHVINYLKYIYIVYNILSLNISSTYIIA